ncbi:MAG: 5'-3' exonuclease [Candidatus Endobugula sp.]|jgi:5'-3' exonuclease
MTQSSSPTLLIDASIYIFQYYFALPDNWFSEDECYPTAAVYGYTAWLVRLLKKDNPQRIAACFDESLGQCFRNEIYSDYKSSRALPDTVLGFQLDACQQVTQLLGVPTYASDRYEADDLLGSLYRACRRSQSPIAILTRDKDLGQLLQRPQDFLWDHAKDQRLTIGGVAEKFSVRPDQLVDYLALVGDAVDNIPGVPGIGAKTASALLGHYGSIRKMLPQLGTLATSPPIGIRDAQSIAECLNEYREQITIAQQLATIVTNLPLIDSVNELNKQMMQREALQDFCGKMGFPKLFKAIDALR